MFFLTLLFTSVVSAVKMVNEERIKRNQQIKEQTIILKVLGISTQPGQSEGDLLSRFKERIKTIQINGRTVYIGYETGGAVIKGYAFQVEGPGFWGPIAGMVSLDRTATKI